MVSWLLEVSCILHRVWLSRKDKCQTDTSPTKNNTYKRTLSRYTDTNFPSVLWHLLTHLLIYLLIYLFNYLLYLLTYLLTPWSRVLLQKISGSRLVKKLPTFYRTRRFITACANARQLCLSWTRSTQSIPPHPTSWRSILMLTSRLVPATY